MDFLDLSLIFDLFLFIIVGCFIYWGAKKGVVSYLFSLLALLIAFPLACYFFPLLSSLFSEDIEKRILSDAIAFASALVVLYFITLALIWALMEALKRFYEDVADLVAGGVVGLLKGITVAIIFILLMITLLPKKAPLLKDSFLSRSTISIVNAIAKQFPPALKNKFTHKKKGLESHWQQTDKVK